MIVLIHHTADKYLDRLNPVDRIRILTALESLEKEPPEGDIISVSGQPGHFRTRVGSYRILWRKKDNAIIVTHIDPRGQVYKKRIRGKRDDCNSFKKRITQYN